MTLFEGTIVAPQRLISGQNPRPKRSPEMLLELAALKADLDAAVERMHADWQLYGIVRKESAEQVHALLLRARSDLVGLARGT